MSYRLERDEPVEGAVRRIACEQIGCGLVEIDDTALDVHETVHQLRKRAKKLRALVRLVRPALGEEVYQRENAALRDAARALSALRDAHAHVETCAALERALDDPAGREVAATAAAALAERRDHLADRGLDPQPPLAAFRAALVDCRQRATGWKLTAEGADAVCPGLARTYRRARRAHRDAYAATAPDPARFHEWRKRVKYDRYHVRLLRELWPDAMAARRAALHRLSDLLGGHHDLATLDRVLAARPAELPSHALHRALLDLARGRRRTLEARARPLGTLVFAETPKAFTRRIARYWAIWRENGDVAAAD